ncbi:MAG TPA: leucyl/phenylalanyl-tRNA--protein transferase [Acidimicrobiales bacterium]|nr:leucyl/phenylalanyl-tRNA--protein transferase [Acidimicrobiales bacterium]
MPDEPPPSRWAFPPVDGADEDGLVGVGADLEPGTILAAYRRGLFPMPVGGRGLVGWWSPDPRAIIPLDGLRVSRSLRRSMRRFEIRVDTAFDEVLDACADPSRPHGWISADVRAAYRRLHDMGWVHSVEAWDMDDGVLAGGLYGLALGGLFAGESMFHRRTDASKAALAGLVDLLRAGEGGPAGRVLDVQWMTPHLASLGAVEVPREDYVRLVAEAVTRPPPPAFGP